MKKAWNALFGGGKNFAEYRGDDQRDTLGDAYFLSHTGIPLTAMDGIRQPEPTTGEFTHGD